MPASSGAVRHTRNSAGSSAGLQGCTPEFANQIVDVIVHWIRTHLLYMRNSAGSSAGLQGLQTRSCKGTARLGV